jgi:5-methyltetrahydrofolate--homocysteine methyltransferase
MSKVLEKISEAVIRGDEDSMGDLTQDALAEGLSAKEILEGGLMPGMDHVGVEFKAGRMFVPEVLLSARTMKGSMSVLEPLLAEGESVAVGKVIMGTVEGDLHDIGKNLVGMMMEGAGFEVVDLGVDVTPEDFVESVKKEKPNIVGMSALLTTTMRNMGRTVDALKEAGLRDQVKIMIGGAPVTGDFAEQIGADGTASSAPAATDLAKEFMGIA